VKAQPEVVVEVDIPDLEGTAEIQVDGNVEAGGKLEGTIELDLDAGIPVRVQDKGFSRALTFKEDKAHPVVGTDEGELTTKFIEKTFNWLVVQISLSLLTVLVVVLMPAEQRQVGTWVTTWINVSMACLVLGLCLTPLQCSKTH
jgi:hypothetical protein